MSFFQNTARPKGFGGKIMVNMMNLGHASLADWGIQHIPIRDDDLILDIGCGGGANIKKLLKKSRHGKAVGIDVSEISVEKAARTNKNAISLGRCVILKGNAMQLPFPKESFHISCAFETIYFWPDLFQAFEQIYGVLKPGGIFMICNEANGENAKDEKWTKRIKGMKIYSYNAMLKPLQKAGFSNIQVDKTSKG